MNQLWWFSRTIMILHLYIQFRVYLFFKISFRWSLWEGHLKENYVGNLQWWPLYHAFYDYAFFLSGIYILVLETDSVYAHWCASLKFSNKLFGCVAAVCNSSSWVTLHRDVSHLLFFFKSSLRHVVPAIVEILQLSFDFLCYVITVICTIHYVLANSVKPL